MNIVILGPGAIGLLWAVKLKQSGHHVSLWARETVPFYRITPDSSEPVQLANHIEGELQQADLILVTVKSWQVAQALETVHSFLHPDTILLLLHNGMGVIDEMPDWIQQHPLVIATTSHGALKTINATSSAARQVHLQHTGQGETWLGAGNDQGKHCTFLTDVLNHALPPVRWHPEIQKAQWQKLAVNCVINPLTALNQCQNGDLKATRYAAQIECLIREIFQVMNAEGITTDAEQLHIMFRQVIEKTDSNYSSMYQDIYHQRRTEIDYITGYLLKSAAKHQISVPENEKLWQQIKAIEAGRQSK